MIGSGLRPDHRAAHALFGDPRKLGHRRRNIFQRDEPQRNQALGVVAAILGGPVVERAEAGGAQLGVIQPEQRHPHRRVDDLGLNAVAVQVLEPVGRVEDAARRLRRSSSCCARAVPARALRRRRTPPPTSARCSRRRSIRPPCRLRSLTVCGARSRNFRSIRSAHMPGARRNASRRKSKDNLTWCVLLSPTRRLTPVAAALRLIDNTQGVARTRNGVRDQLNPIRKAWRRYRARSCAIGRAAPYPAASR